MQDLFASDYGVLGREFFSLEYLTNPSELMRSEEVYHILHLCGIDAREGGALSSDWELFSSFCRAYPMLHGHLVATRIASVLRECLSLSLPFDAENAVALWHEGVERLLHAPMQTSSLFAEDVPWLCDGETVPDALPAGIAPVLDGGQLMPQRGEALAEWQERIREVFAHFLEHGCVAVRLSLPSDTSFVEPNPYAVGQSLASRHRDKRESALITAQLLREMSAVCILYNLPLTLECAGRTEIGEMLRYVSRTVGLPPLTVSPKDPDERDALLSLADQTDLRIALRLSDVPTEREMADALESMAARYPIGRVRLITGADLRHSGVAQRGAAHLLCRFTEKTLEKK